MPSKKKETTAPRVRGKARRLNYSVMARHRSSLSSLSASNRSVTVIPDFQHAPHTVVMQSHPQSTSDDSAQNIHIKKKRIRISKKFIPTYHWTTEKSKKLADFVKQNPQLFDKRHKDWLNKTFKPQLWALAGADLDPPASGEQSKNQYENMRTRVGKTLNREKKSGSETKERTMREEEIMEMWGFLTGHIVHGETTASEDFSNLMAEPEVEAQTDEDFSSAGLLDLSMNGKGKSPGKKSRPQPSTLATYRSAVGTPTVTSGTTIAQSDLNHTLQQIISRADTLGQRVGFTGQRKIVHDFACLLEGHMQNISEDNWHNFEIECLTLVHRYKKPS